MIGISWHLYNYLYYESIIVTDEKKKSTPILDAANRLRYRYLAHLPPAKVDWPKHCVYDYVKLALVEKDDVTLRDDHVDDLTKLTLQGGNDQILKKKTPINDLSGIFHYKNEQLHDRLILIMGGPGEYT